MKPKDLAVFLKSEWACPHFREAVKEATFWIVVTSCVIILACMTGCDEDVIDYPVPEYYLVDSGV